MNENPINDRQWHLDFLNRKRAEQLQRQQEAVQRERDRAELPGRKGNDQRPYASRSVFAIKPDTPLDEL